MISILSKKIGDCEDGRGLNIFLNLYSYMVLREDVGVIESIDRVLVDGGLLVFFLRLFLGWRFKRVSFDMTSLAPIVFKRAIFDRSKVYLLGAREEQIDEAVQNFKERFSGLDISGYRSGYFSSQEERKKTIEVIVLNSPDIVVVGMGVPLQEQFLIDLRKAGWRGAGFTCGGFFHQSAKSVDYYPKILDRLNLRWLYRMYDEPKLIKRYLVDYTKSMCLLLYDVMKYRLHKKRY